MILLTGGAGFIGSVLLKELNLNGRDDIIIVDRLHSGEKWKNLRAMRYNKFIHADELFLPKYQADLENIDLIFHLGACSSTTQTDVDYLYKNNVEYSQELFKLATQKNIPMVYASSAATYGDGAQGYDDRTESIDKLRPLNPYGYSKQLFDQWVLKQEAKPKTWYGLKFFNVYGPNEYHKGSMKSVVFQSFQQIKQSGEVNLFKSHRPDFKDGEQKRDFIYAKDVARAMVALIHDDQGKNSGIYNLGTGKARTFFDLAKNVFAALDLKPNIKFMDMPDHLKNQYQYYTQANMDRFKAILPNFKFSSLEEGIKDYVSNNLNKENPYLDTME